MFLKKAVCFIVCLISFLSFAQTEEKIIEDVMGVLNAQENAWNAHDLDAFMHGYWQSDELIFVGSKGPTYGWKQTLENYKKGYPTPEAMGILHFDVLNTMVWDQYTVYMVGKFTLKRMADQPEGYFSILWRNINGEWRIVSDHSSASAQ